MKASVEIIEPKLFDGAVADEIVASAQDAISERGRCSLVLAGGSTPGAIYRALSKPPRVEDMDWSALSLYWGDERWVPHSDNQSNFKMTQETLLGQISAAKPRQFPVNTDASSPEAAAEEYSSAIVAEEKVSPGQLPSFDIVLLGVGEDGHTASVFPGSRLLKTPSSRLCEAVEHPVDGKTRITLTPEALFAAKKIFFIAKGEGKAEIMKRVLEGEDSEHEIPARLFLRADERVTFFLDSGAAQKLSKTK